MCLVPSVALGQAIGRWALSSILRPLACPPIVPWKLSIPAFQSAGAVHYPMRLFFHPPSSTSRSENLGVSGLFADSFADWVERG